MTQVRDRHKRSQILILSIWFMLISPGMKNHQSVLIYLIPITCAG